MEKISDKNNSKKWKKSYDISIYFSCQYTSVSELFRLSSHNYNCIIITVQYHNESLCFLSPILNFIINNMKFHHIFVVQKHTVVIFLRLKMFRKLNVDKYGMISIVLPNPDGILAVDGLAIAKRWILLKHQILYLLI